MKKVIYIKSIFLLFFVYVNCFKKTEQIHENEKFIVKLSYVGNIDKPLPTLIFLDSCEESNELLNYKYNLNYKPYYQLKKEIKNFKSDLKINSSLVCISFNKNQNYYLNKEKSILIVSKLLQVTLYKNNKQLKSQLNLYLKVLKSK